MMANVTIKDVASYHPSNVVSNETFFEHFKQQGKNVEKFLTEVFGRDRRYLSTNKSENVLTMGIEASKRVLEKSELSGKDIDMVVFSSGTPEYVQPTNAIKVHQAINGKNRAVVYDMNANCVGMVYAVDQVSRYMLTNPNIKYALVVGADQMNRYAKETDEITYPNFADASSAVILERAEETERGFVDSLCYTNSEAHNNIVLPGCGFSHLYDDTVSEEDKKVNWIPFDGTCSNNNAKEDIEILLKRHNIHKGEVKQYLFSQFAKINIDLISKSLEEDESKFMYVGDEFAYTGTSSPFLALERAVDEGKVNRGDIIVFWSVGAGWTICSLLFKY